STDWDDTSCEEAAQRNQEENQNSKDVQTLSHLLIFSYLADLGWVYSKGIEFSGKENHIKDKFIELPLKID
ncbi:MAG TPA: hypothetical protein VJ876_08610, partial [Bacteroidales bacterium]|nr:hypothetical protein [Bacteroidales bacterium]